MHVFNKSSFYGQLRVEHLGIVALGILFAIMLSFGGDFADFYGTIGIVILGAIVCLFYFVIQYFRMKKAPKTIKVTKNSVYFGAEEIDVSRFKYLELFFDKQSVRLQFWKPNKEVFIKKVAYQYEGAIEELKTSEDFLRALEDNYYIEFRQ